MLFCVRRERESVCMCLVWFSFKESERLDGTRCDAMHLMQKTFDVHNVMAFYSYYACHWAHSSHLPSILYV